MNASELSRKLLYCGHNDLTDYLRNSPLNRYLYKLMLVELPKNHIDLPIQTLFSEIYYQCVRVRFDGNPGQDVYERYLIEEERWLNSRPAAELVFSIVWILLHLRHPLSFNEECFFEQLSPLIDESPFRQFAKDLEEGICQHGLGVIEEIAPMPCPVKDIPFSIQTDINPSKFKEFLYIVLDTDEERLEASMNPWKVITNNFSRSSIERYISVYNNTEDQMELLERIRLACPRKEYAAHESDFSDIKELISAERFLANYKAKDEDRLSPVAQTMDEYDQMFAAGYNQTMAEAENDKEEQYRQECNTLRYQLGELKKDYEARLAENEAMHQSEIETLKSELMAARAEQTDHVTGNRAVAVETTPTEFSLTVAEMASYVIKNFSESAANEFINLYYHFAIQYNNLDDDASKIMDGIIPAIHRRNAPQTQIEIPTVQQVNINPQNVNNNTKESSK